MAYLVVAGLHYDSNGVKVDDSVGEYQFIDNYRGLFDFLCGESNIAISRFGYRVYENEGKFYFNLPKGSRTANWFSLFKAATNKGWPEETGNVWNQIVPNSFTLDKIVYLTMVFDGENGQEYLYMNGREGDSVQIDKSYWNGFLKDFNDFNIDSILLGAGSMHKGDWWHLTNMDCYAIRLYFKALTEEEVLENYNMTVSYHKFLEKGGSSVVGAD